MFDFDSALGVSVDGDDLVLANVSKGLRSYALRSAAVIENYASLESTELQRRVQAFTELHRVNRDNIVLGIPRDQVVVRQIELPLEVEENIRQVVRFQVEKLQPGDEDSSWFDHVVLDRNEKTKSISLQIVMAPAAAMDAWLKLLKELDLYPAAVRHGSVGLQQVFKGHKDGLGAEPSLVLNIGKDSLEVAVVSDKGRCFSRKTSLPSKELDVAGVFKELDDFVPRLRLSEEGVRKIYLTGERAESLAEAFRERFGSGELLEKGFKLRLDNGIVGQPPRFAEAVGLALSGLEKSPFSKMNLLPEEKRLTGQRPSFIPTVAIAAMLAVMVFAAGTREYFQQAKRLNAIEAELAALLPDKERAQAVRAEVERKLAEASELQGLMTGQQSILLVLKELTEKIPDDAYLQSLSIQNDKANMTGFADTAANLIAILQTSEYLKGVESRYINRDRMGKERFNFEARVQLPGQPDAP